MKDPIEVGVGACLAGVALTAVALTIARTTRERELEFSQGVGVLRVEAPAPLVASNPINSPKGGAAPKEPAVSADPHPTPPTGIDPKTTQLAAGAVLAPGPVGGAFFTSPDYAPSRERFLELSAAIYCALDLTIEELQDVDAWFWESNPEYAYLLNQKPEETLRDYFQIEDPRLALERQWTEEGTLPLWREHMRLFKQQHMGHVTGAELSLTRARLFAARDAIWSGVSPDHQFLFRLDQETR